MEKLLLVEHQVDLITGHFQTTPRTILNLSPNYEFFILANKELDLIRYDGTSVPQIQFEGTVKYRHLRKKGNILQHLARQLSFTLGLQHSADEKIFEAVQTFNFKASDHVLIPSAQQNIFVSTINLIDKLVKQGNPRQLDKLPKFHFRLLSEIFSEIQNCETFLLKLKHLIAHGKVKLYCETHELISYLQERYNLQIVSEPMILACTLTPLLPQTMMSKIERRDMNFRVAHLGAARRDKGSHRLVEIIKELRLLNRQRSTNRKTITVVIQFDLSKPEACYEELASLPLDEDGIRIEPLGKTLSTQDFINQTHLCDAFLLPYEHEGQRTQGSGLILDAIFAKKLIFLSSNMSMREFLGFGNAVSAESDKEFAHSIIDVANCERMNLEKNLETAFLFAKSQVTRNIDL